MAVGIKQIRLPMPGPVLAAYRFAYLIHRVLFRLMQWLITFFLREPAFRSRCETFGKRVLVSRLPFIMGQPKIHIGNDVNFFGSTVIYAGSLIDEPTLIIKDRVDIGHLVSFVVNCEIVIEEDVNIANGVCFRDSDGHPRDTEARIADLGPPLEEVKPVRICRYAWIGGESHILKGVTIGEGAVIGVNSVVVTDIPPYTVAMGNPARVVAKGLKPPPGSAYAKAEEPGPGNPAVPSGIAT